MKIAIDISQSVYEGTGVASYTRNLVNELIAQNRQDCYVLFGASFRRQDSLIEYINALTQKGGYSTRFTRLPPTLLTLLWNKLHLVTIEIFTGAVDVVHTSDWTEPPSHIPKVTTIHDLIVYKYPENFPVSIVNNQKAKLNWVKKESKLIIADSLSTKKDIVTYLKIPPEKIRVIYLGVDPVFFQQKIDSILALKKRLKIEKQYILCVGTQEPRKNLQRVVQAFNQLKLSEYELVIAGNHGWGEVVTQEESVKITGFISNSDLATLYSGATCFVYPSLYEGFGLPVLEAMACGVPVVTSDQGSLAEIVGTAAIIVNPFEVEAIVAGIKKVLNLSEKEQKNLTSRAKKHSQKFTWQKTAEQTLAIYKEVAG